MSHKIDSTNQKVAFTFSILKMLGDTLNKYKTQQRVWHEPESIGRDMLLVEHMVRRYRRAKYEVRGTKVWPNFQHTQREAEAEANVALWVHNQARALAGREELLEPTWEMPWLKQGVPGRRTKPSRIRG